MSSKKISKEEKSREVLAEALLKRKRKDTKPWQPKGTFRLDRELQLGTRLKGEIHRRPDRPFAEINLSDDTRFDHFDEFERKYDFQKNYVKNRLKRLKLSNTTSSYCEVNKDRIPGNKREKRGKIHRSKTSRAPQKRIKKTKKTNMFTQSYQQAQNILLATRKVRKNSC